MSATPVPSPEPSAPHAPHAPHAPRVPHAARRTLQAGAAALLLFVTGVGAAPPAEAAPPTAVVGRGP
ncbi:hypothetical protein [Streptomyces sp. NPDC041003]|uniref:hypothetical protein n=1 Tax=Streptomyces sp. NPDC041003 TaxID=3155730 RepID=UPI00340BF1AF